MNAVTFTLPPLLILPFPLVPQILRPRQISSLQDSEVQKDAVRLMYREKAERSCPRCVNPLPSRHAPIAFSVLCRAGHMSPVLQAMTSILPQLMGLVWTHARAEHLGSCYIKAEEHGSWGCGAMGGSTDSMSNW